MRIRRFVMLVPILALAACQPEDGGQSADATVETAGEVESSGIVNVTAREFAFDMPSELPAGWTTFRFKNAGAQEHFASIRRMPEGKNVENYRNEVGKAFDSAMDPYYAGEVELESALQAVGEVLPAWFGEAPEVGGPGLVSPGGTAVTTVELAPGYYVIECYVKTADNKFHVSLGMLAGFVVTGESNGAVEPESDFDVTLANYVIDAPASVSAGPHTIRVRVLQDPEGMLMHDVHLFRVAEDTDMNAVIPWMSWIDGMVSPAPVTFVGGAEGMHAGSVGYMTVDLEPGSYAWISEGYAAQGMVKEFVVE